jgi:hypothetical protein
VASMLRPPSKHQMQDLMDSWEGVRFFPIDPFCTLSCVLCR